MHSGTITQVRGPVVDVRFPETDIPPIYTALKVNKLLPEPATLILEVVQHLGDQTVRCIAMGETIGLARHMVVQNTGAPIQVPVGFEGMGRILSGIGEPLDGRGPVATTQWRPLHGQPVSFLTQSTEREMVTTGIKAIDLLAPIVWRGRNGIVGELGMWGSLTLDELFRHLAIERGARSLYVNIGESTAYGADAYEEHQRAHSANLFWFIVASMSEPAGLRMRAIHTALTIAEYLRDEQENDILIFIDKFSHHVRACSEATPFLDLLPGPMGYPTDLLTELGMIQDRMSAIANKGSITTFQTISDLDDIAILELLPSLDSLIRFSSKTSIFGRLPPIDLLQSTSQILVPSIVGQEHYDVAMAVRKTLHHYSELQPEILSIGIDSMCHEDRRTIERARRLSNFLTQPFFVAEIFTGSPGRYVDIRDTIRGCKEILEGRYDHLPEGIFFMVGTIKDAMEKARRWGTPYPS